MQALHYMQYNYLTNCSNHSKFLALKSGLDIYHLPFTPAPEPHNKRVFNELQIARIQRFSCK